MNSAPQTQNYCDQPVTGALFVLSASFVFAILGALIKIVSASLSNEMIVFFRNLCALIFILPWLWYSRPPGGVRTSCFQLHLLRSIVGLGAMYCFFYTIAHLQLSEAFLLIATAPLFIPVIAFVWMREPVANHVRGAVILGFTGIVLILKPGFGIFQPIALVGLGAGVLAALAMVCIRRMSALEPAIRIVFYFTALSTIISAGPLLWYWQSPQPELWWLLILIGLLAVVLAYFACKAFYFCFRIRENIFPDEITHFGISELFARSLLPPVDSADSFALGLITHVPTLYYVLMGKLLQLLLILLDLAMEGLSFLNKTRQKCLRGRVFFVLIVEICGKISPCSTMSRYRSFV